MIKKFIEYINEINNANDFIFVTGRIKFDPKNYTKKQDKQSEWKRIAIVEFDNDEMSEYYSWFIKKRYNLPLNKPLRGSHISFINDSIRNIVGGQNRWEEIKKKWNGTNINVILDPDVRTNSEHWWLMADSPLFDQIRIELGLGKPYFSYHLTIGYASDKNINHSKYIHDMVKKYGNNYN